MSLRAHTFLPASCLLAASLCCPGPASAQHISPAAAPVGLSGLVVAADGAPVGQALVTAVGTVSTLAVTDAEGAFTIGNLPPGPYLIRVHRAGFRTGQGQWVTLVPAASATIRLTLVREASTAEAVTTISAASVAGDVEGTRSAGIGAGTERSDSWLAWHLRRLKRTVLKDEGIGAVTRATQAEGFSPADPFEYLGRVLGTSSNAAMAVLEEMSIDGQVDLLTTSALAAPVDVGQPGEARGVAFFALRTDAGPGTWQVRAAVNQGELDSWTLAASHAGQLGDTHRYQSGMAYSLQRYQGAAVAALAASPEGDRHVGSIFLQDEWSLTPVFTLTYGGAIARYDYLAQQALLSGRVTASYGPADTWRAYAAISRDAVAPGGQEFVAPARSQWLPPQRTFSPLEADRFSVGQVDQYSAGVERQARHLRVGLRAFQQRVQNQFVTVFEGAAVSGGNTGHYLVGAAGDVDLSGVTVSVSHLLWNGVRASADYSMATSRWQRSMPVRRARTPDGGTQPVPGAATVPAQIHDVVSTIDAVVPATETRVFAVYRLSNAFLSPAGEGASRLQDGRFELQFRQSLPFMKFTNAQWEMLVTIRNMFYEQAAAVSLLDEALVVGAPRRLVGGLTVRF